MIEKKTILAIDDDVTVLTTVRTILDRSYDVCLAKNLDIAKKILTKTGVDLILLDMEMPDHSGMEFLESIRSSDSYYSIPVIVVSSHGVADVIVDAQKKGAVDFIVKPIVPKILLEKIQSAFKNTRKKISKATLSRKLQNLENSCTHGKSSDIERIIKDLEQFCFDLKTDTEIALICKYARGMEYNLVDERIKILLSELSE